MAEINYLDFDLLIERLGAAYRVRVSSSPVGQATASFSMPFSELEVENFVLRIGRTRRGVRRWESPEMEAARTFGRRLFEAVFDDEVRGRLRGSMNEASRRGLGLRIRLRLADAPELADLPWEYLYDPALDRFLVLSIETPLVRYLDLPQPVRPLVIEPPLRVLVMISSPSDYPLLDTNREWAKLKDALSSLESRGLMALHRLEQATLAALQRQLRRQEYHIFHFVGHGGFDAQAQDGVLVLETERELGHPVGGWYLGTLLQDHRTLRLAILNACEGARASRSDPFAGTAQSLVRQGIPAVLAMQFEISDEAAVTLANEFYAALADGYPVDAALTEARRAIFARGSDVEWGTPVLYMHSPDGRIFDVERVSDEERQRVQVAALHHEAQAAMAREDWATAIEKLQAVLALAPAHADAAAELSRARRQQELATLYAEGEGHYQAGRWHEALASFRQVQDIAADYRDVGAMVAAVERALARAERAGVSRRLPSKTSRWLWIGIPAVLVLVALAYLVGRGILSPGPDSALTSTPPLAAVLKSTPTPTPTHLPTLTPVPTRRAPTLTPTREPPTPTPTHQPPTPTRGQKLPTPTPAWTPTPNLLRKGAVTAVVAVDSAALHAGPDPVYVMDSSFGRDITISVLGQAPEGRWLAVVSDAGQLGWIATDSLHVQASLSAVPVIEDHERLKISGQVVDSLGEPIQGINIAVIQRDDDYLRADIYSGAGGAFYFYAPKRGVWDVQQVGTLCSSRIMDSDCNLRGYVQVHARELVPVPQTEPVVFVYEKATSAIAGKVVDSQGNPVAGMRVIAGRSDGAKAWGSSSQSGQFELPALDGTWEVYALRFSPSAEGAHVTVNVTEGTSLEPITVIAP